MMILKSSWRMLIILVMSSCSFNIINGSNDEQRTESSDYVRAPQIPTVESPRAPLYSNQPSNAEAIRYFHNAMKLRGDSPVADLVGLYDRQIIQLISRASDQQKVFNDFKSRHTNAVKPSSVISEKQVIENLETVSVAIYETLMGNPIIDRINSPTPRVGEELSRLAQSLRATINRIKREIPQIVINHRDAQINGNVYFNLKNADGINLISELTEVHKNDPSNLLDDLIYRQNNSHNQINGPIHLIKRSSAHKLVTGTTNDFNLTRDFVYKGQSQFQIKSTLRVGSLSSHYVSTRSSLDQVNPDNLVFLNSQTPVTISSQLIFDSRVTVDNNLSVSTISGVHLPTLRSSALTYNSDQIVDRPIAIRSVEVPSVQLRGLLNGLDYNRRVVRLLRSDLPIKVPRLIVASESFRANNLNHVRSLNNQRFPDDFLLVNSNQSQTIPVPINFSTMRITRGANVKGLINGLKYPESFVTLDANETIYSNLIFSDSVSFNKDFTSENYIGKHRLSDLVDWVYGRNPFFRQIRNNPSGNVFVNGDLQVTSINGLQLDVLLNDLVHLAEPNSVQVTGTKTFTNPLHISSITIKEINRSPLTDFASSLNPIVSPIQFVNPLVINNLNWKFTGKPNRISDLINKRISLVNEGTINGDISIETMSIDSLQVDPLENHRINNLSPRQLVFSKHNQHIHGPLTFTDLTFLKPIWATKLNIGQTFNRRDINRIMKNSVNPQKRQNFNFDRLVLRNCQINSLIPNLSGDWRLYNRLLVKSLRNLLLKNSDQIIFGRKRFLYPVFFDSNIASRSPRGVLHGIQKGPLFLPSDLIIKNKLRLSNLVIHGNLQINGKLNEIDLSVPLIDLQFYRDISYSMISPQSFYSGLTASKIHVNYINGQPFDKYWSKRKPLQFKAPVTIGNLIVDGPVHLNGLVNNLPIEKVFKQIRDQQNHQSITIHGDVVFKSPINIINNLNISGLINSVNFGELKRSLSKLSTIKEITGVKTFKSIDIKGNLRVNRLNGRQLNDFLYNIVLIHPNNKVLLLTSPVEFTSMTTIREDISSDRLRSNFNSNINGINMRKLLIDHQEQFERSSTMATLVFTDPVFLRSPSIKIMGKVNNLDLSRDIIWLHDHFQPHQIITGHKSFKRAHFKSNVYVHSTVNGIDSTDRLREIIDPRSTQNITNGIKFGGKMILTSGLFVSMIGNIPASSLIVTNQPTRSIVQVPARWTFNGPSMVVKTDLIVDGRIQNVSIQELTRYSLKKHVPQTINVPMHFDRVVLKSVDPISNMFTDLQSIQRSYSNRWDQVASRLKALDQTISSNDRISSKITDYIDSAPMVIKGFTIVQQFPEIIGTTINLRQSQQLNYSISVGSFIDENVSYTNLIFNGSQFNDQGNYMITPYIAVHPFKLGQFSYNLYQASPNSTYPSVLIDDEKHVIGQLSGRAYDDLQVLSINGRDKFISALSSVRGVVETFTFTMVNGQPTILLISTLNVTPNAKKISLFMMINEIYLVVARSSDSDCESDNSSSLLFHWLDKKFKLIQRFGHFEATNVVYYKFNGHSYLVFSESKGKVDRLTDKAIHVYQSVFKQWPYCQFNHFNSINFEHTIDLQVITIPSPSRSIQLLAALNSSTLTIWQQKGNAGFTRIWSQSLNEGQAFKFFTLNSNLYLIVAQLSRQVGSFIMKAIS